MKIVKLILGCFVIFLACLFNNVYAEENEDIYDVVLFWGQSNMTGYAGINDEEKVADARVSSVGVDNFSTATGIDKSILNNYTSMNHVNVPIESGSVYEYMYSNNSLVAINKDTEYIGEMLEMVNDNGTLNLVSCDRKGYFALQKSYGTNMAVQFSKTLYEKTGHKVVIVMASNGGEEIAHFLPHADVLTYSKSTDDSAKNQYIYEAMVKKYNAAILYLSQNNMKIGNRFYVAFQGLADAIYAQNNQITTDDYYTLFGKLHSYLKRDCSISFGAIVESASRVGIVRYNGTLAIHNAQERLINSYSDIILASSYPYDKYVPEEAAFTGTNYNTALTNARYSMCMTSVDNSIHFTSAALSQIGLDSANHVFEFLNSSVVDNKEDEDEPVASEDKPVISSLKINDANIKLDDKVTSYQYTVPYNVSEAIISVELSSDEFSFVDGYGPRTIELNEGDNKVEIRVLKNNQVVSYYVTISREKNVGDENEEILENPKTGSGLLGVVFILFVSIFTVIYLYSKRISILNNKV